MKSIGSLLAYGLMTAQVSDLSSVKLFGASSRAAHFIKLKKTFDRSELTGTRRISVMPTRLPSLARFEVARVTELTWAKARRAAKSGEFANEKPHEMGLKKYFCSS